MDDVSVFISEVGTEADCEAIRRMEQNLRPILLLETTHKNVLTRPCYKI